MRYTAARNTLAMSNAPACRVILSIYQQMLHIAQLFRIGTIKSQWSPRTFPVI